VRRPFPLTATLSFLVQVWCASVFALDSYLNIRQFAHTAWRVRAVLIQGAIL
jgi:hypothetical protein